MIKLNKKITIGIITLLLLVASGLFYFSQNLPLPQVVSTNPHHGANNITETSPIFVRFNREVSKAERKKLDFTITPSHELSPAWSSDGFELSLNPQSPFQTNTRYHITIQLKTDLLHEFSFTTQRYSTQELKQQIEEQSEDDKAFAEAERKIFQTYPWYVKLPIETPEFRIVYDYEKKSFRIRILKPNPSPEEKTQIIESALGKLKAINVDPDKETYYVLP